MEVIKIEYYNDPEEKEYSQFELFNSIEKAYDFLQFEGIEIVKINVVKVNPNNLYFEDNGTLNYEDNSELFI